MTVAVPASYSSSGGGGGGKESVSEARDGDGL